MSMAKCYVTGLVPTEKYYFGAEDRLVLALTQEVFGRFILAASKDEEHRANVAKAQDAAERLAKLVRNKRALTDDDVLDRAIELHPLLDELNAALTAKMISGVRILRQLRASYKDNGNKFE